MCTFGSKNWKPLNAMSRLHFLTFWRFQDFYKKTWSTHFSFIILGNSKLKHEKVCAGIASMYTFQFFSTKSATNVNLASLIIYMNLINSEFLCLYSVSMLILFLLPQGNSCFHYNCALYNMWEFWGLYICIVIVMRCLCIWLVISLLH